MYKYRSHKLKTYKKTVSELGSVRSVKSDVNDFVNKLSESGNESLKNIYQRTEKLIKVLNENREKTLIW